MFKKKLSEHFRLSEFVKPEDEAAYKARPDRPLIEHRLEMLATTLEIVRAELNIGKHSPEIPINVSSGWRSWKRNKRVGGSPTSDHPQGYCADVWCPFVNAGPLFAAFVSAQKRGLIAFDQLILYPRHVHISVNPRNRGMAFASKH